jgi:hypothetical protein
MAGFNFVPPVPQLTAAQLAALGLAAFKPPPLLGMPGMPGAPMGGGQQGMGIGEGMAGLSGALKGLGRGVSPALAEQRAHPGYGVLDPSKANMSTSAIDRMLDPSLGSIPGNTSPYGNVGDLMSAKGLGGGGDFLSGFGDWLSQLFGSGAGGGLAGGAGALFP